VAVLTKSVERLIAEVDTNPAAFCDRQSIIARELLAPVRKSVEHLAQTYPVIRCNGETVIAIERLMTRFDDLFNRVQVQRANQGGSLREAGTGY
jgi:hypothetical protein